MQSELSACTCGANGFIIDSKAVKKWKVACTKCSRHTELHKDKQEAIRAWGK